MFVISVSVESKAESIVDLWIILSDSQSVIEILLGFFEFLQVKMALSSVHQELCVLVVSLDCVIVVF